MAQNDDLPLLKVKVYLAGPIENANDYGLGWRQVYKDRLDALGGTTVIPNLIEDQRIPHKELRKLKITDISAYVRAVRDIIDADLQVLNDCDAVVTLWDGTWSAGTMHEVGHAFEYGIPVYIVSEIAPELIPGWFLSCATAIGRSLEEVIEYIKENKCSSSFMQDYYK